MKKNRVLTPMICVFAVLFAATSSAAVNFQTKKPQQGMNPANFVSQIDNEFFPLTPGATYIYQGESEGIPTRAEMYVTNDTKLILGVTCIVVHDRAYQDGVLIEDTFDWYAQDVDGNVWYFGEATQELDENGNVISTEGSWEAGVNGAKPGIIMLANPKKGDRYRQESASDVAEDMAQVVNLNESICVSYGCFDHVLVTKEWTLLEKGVVENKYYVEGIGFIFSEMVKGGDETSELIRVHGQ